MLAILKAINVKSAGRKKFLETLEYVSNPEKNKNESSKYKAKAQNFEIDTFVNRYLHAKRDSKRQFKQFVVSMSIQWPSDSLKRKRYEKSLEEVLHSCERYFREQGFMVSGWIHHNTAHPHFHILLETCNAITGKQYSQSKSDLAIFKVFINSQLIINDLNEEILREINNITEEELLLEEETDFSLDLTELNEVYESEKENSHETSVWNFGTSELRNIIYSYKPQEFKTMIKIIQPVKRCEMARIVTDEPNAKREMVRIISDEPNAKREMMRIISDEPNAKREMVRIVTDEPNAKREMVRIVTDEKLIEK